MCKAGTNNYLCILIAKIDCAHCKKYRSKLHISRSLVTIFAYQNAKIDCAHCKKYRSKLHISRSLVTIFAPKMLYSKAIGP